MKIGGGSNGPLGGNLGEESPDSSWRNLTRDLTDSLADAWFGDYELVPLESEILSGGLKNDKILIEMAYPPIKGDQNTLDQSPKIISGLLSNESEFGEQCPPEDSIIGRELIKCMNKVGISWNFKTQFFFNDFEQVDTTAALTEARRIGDHESQQVLAQTIESLWQTESGQAFHQRLKIFRDAAGRESAYWHFPALASTRPLSGIAEWDPSFADFTFTPPSGNAGKWVECVSIPLLAKKLFYLAETEFPNATMSFSRTLTWGDFSPDQIPQPRVAVSRFGEVTGVTSYTEGRAATAGTIFPDVFQFGLVFTVTDAQSLELIVNVLSNALIRIATTLEDGYQNFLGVDYPAPYEWVTMSMGDLTFTREESATNGICDCMPRLLPTTLLGHELTHHRSLYFELANAKDGNTPAHQARLASYVSDAVGPYWAVAANDLIWSYLIPQKRWDEIDRLALKVIDAQVKRESTNALSNQAISHYMRGDIQGSRQMFMQILEHAENTSDDEAHWWLALICRDSGEIQLATKHTEACNALGGYEEPAFLRENTSNSQSGFGKFW